MRDRIFLSYSHEDAGWKDRFLTRFKAAQLWDNVEVWSDDLIPHGEDWRREIEKKIQASRVALFLVSDSFLESEFIACTEFPLLKEQQKRGLSIHWVPLDEPRKLRNHPFEKRQALWPIDKPLNELPTQDYDRAVKQICDAVIAKIPHFSPRRRSTLKEQVQRNLEGIKVKDEIGSGDFSVVFLGDQRGRSVTIKVLDAPFASKGPVADFRQAACMALKLKHQVFITIYDHLPLWKRPPAFVREYVEGETLELLIERRGRVPVAEAARIARPIAEALGEAHEQGLVYGNLKSSDILMQESRRPRPRLSAVAFACSVRKTSCRRRGINYGDLTLLLPEQYYGDELTFRSDQYSLALVICQMLDGVLPARVESLADLEERCSFFEAPVSFLGRWTKQYPQFAHIVLRMLRKKPELRYDNMSGVVRALDALSDEALAEETALFASARQLYSDVIRRPELNFMPQFYASFQALCDEAKVENLLARDSSAQPVDWERLYEMASLAIQSLFDYGQSKQEKYLKVLAEKHAKDYGVEPIHFDLFAKALRYTLGKLGAEYSDRLDAWDEAIRPGIEYMKNSCSMPGRGAFAQPRAAQLTANMTG